jgi:hypothetical protein
MDKPTPRWLALSLVLLGAALTAGTFALYRYYAGSLFVSSTLTSCT